MRRSDTVSRNPRNALIAETLCQGGSNVIQAEEYDYGCVDDGAEDIDEGSENGTEDALGPEDGERKGDDDPCTVG